MIFQKIKTNKTILIILALLFFLFYWFQVRVIAIKKNCSNQAEAKINSNNKSRGYIPIAERLDNNYKDFSDYYKKCLIENGL